MFFQSSGCLFADPRPTPLVLWQKKRNVQTLDALLASDLRDREIVLGTSWHESSKLGMIFLGPYPIFSFLQFLGGVEPVLIVAGFIFTAVSMCSLAALSLFFSVRSEKPREALVKTYLVTIVFVAALTLIWVTSRAYPRGRHTRALRAGRAPSPWKMWLAGPTSATRLSCGSKSFAGVAIGSTLDKLLPEVLAYYAAFHGFLILLRLWLCDSLSCAVMYLAKARNQKRHKGQDYSIKAWMRSNWGYLPVLAERPMLWKEFLRRAGR